MKDKEIVISQLIGKILKECCKFSHNMLFHEYVFDNEKCGDFSGFKLNKGGEGRRSEFDVDLQQKCFALAKFIEPEVYKLLKDEIVVVFKYNIEVTEEADMFRCVIQYEIGKL
jgi:hypothetical protein